MSSIGVWHAGRHGVLAGYCPGNCHCLCCSCTLMPRSTTSSANSPVCALKSSYRLKLGTLQAKAVLALCFGAGNGISLQQGRQHNKPQQSHQRSKGCWVGTHHVCMCAVIDMPPGVGCEAKSCERALHGTAASFGTGQGLVTPNTLVS